MNILNINIVDSWSEAPVYRQPEHIGLELKEALIVGKGTHEGNPTVDLLLVGPDGQKYVAMVTGKLLESLGGACRGKRERDAQ